MYISAKKGRKVNPFVTLLLTLQRSLCHPAWHSIRQVSLSPQSHFRNEDLGGMLSVMLSGHNTSESTGYVSESHCIPRA